MKQAAIKVGAILLAISLCLWYLLPGSSRDIDIQGVVVQEANGQPVSQARVQVVVYEYRYFSEVQPRVYSCIADDQGRFRIQATSPILVDAMKIEACAPDDSYALDKSPGRTVTLRVKPLGYNNDLAPKYRYGTFRGKYGSDLYPEYVVDNTIEPAE